MALCAEAVRDKIGGIYEGAEMCDCIVFDSDEKKLSLVELKSGMHKRGKLKLLRKARNQLASGLCMLLKILRDMDKPEIKIQAVLSSNEPFRSVVMLKEFQQPLKGPVRIKLKRVDCGSDLPELYVTVKVT